MNRANRAAQFAPFDALKGLQEALREKEEQLMRVERRELSVEMQDELSEMLTQAEKGMVVEIEFYYNGHYISLQDKLSELNAPFKYIIVGKAKVYFSDLYNLKIIERC